MVAEPALPAPLHVSETADTDSTPDVPAGLLVSVGERGGYALPRQLDGSIRR